MALTSTDKREKHPMDLQNLGEKVCGATKKDGDTCNLKAGHGTDHKGYGPCKYHMGSTRSMRVASFKAMSRDYVRSLTDEHDIHPLDAMLWAVRLSAGATYFWQSVLAGLELTVPALFDVLNDEGALAAQDLDPELLDGLKSVAMDLAAALEGVVGQYGTERDRLARTSKMCLEIGIAERQVALNERQGDMVFDAIDAALRQIRQLHPDLPLSSLQAGRSAAAHSLLAIPVESQVASVNAPPDYPPLPNA